MLKDKSLYYYIQLNYFKVMVSSFNKRYSSFFLSFSVSLFHQPKPSFHRRGGITLNGVSA